ncbi:MAG: pyruvate ferredoxin oxidoreductase, partial [Bacteroidaceae bacterium]|nr:pyruvate ferredoxin oxidoreductase [Bacteroidaceae bacterium]
MLDYKYIEQILDKFFECDTTLEEEKILRTFFSQNDVPESLAKYKELFVYQQTETANNTLGEDFDEKMMRL